MQQMLPEALAIRAQDASDASQDRTTPADQPPPEPEPEPPHQP